MLLIPAAAFFCLMSGTAGPGLAASPDQAVLTVQADRDGLLRPDRPVGGGGSRLWKAGALSSVILLGLLILGVFQRRDLRRHVADLEAVRREMLEQTELLRLATEATHAGVWDYHADRQSTFLSAQWLVMLGYPARERDMPWKEFRALIHPEDRPSLEASLAIFLEGGGHGFFEIEFRLLRADGSWNWVLSKSKVVGRDHSGRPERIIGLDVNIQTLKTAQLEMKKNDAVFRAIFENAPYAIVISRLSDGRYLDANPAFLKSRGLTRDDLPTLNFREHARISSEEADAVIHTLMTEGSISHREVSVTDPDGRIRHLSFSSVLMDIDGQQQVLSMTVDLTEQKTVELALKKSEERFRSLFRFAPIPLISMGLDGSVLAINDRLTQVLGYEINDFPDEDAWWTTIYPDPAYRLDVRRRWDAAVNKALARKSGIESDECRVTCRDGRVLSMIVEANVIGDILLVSFFDITEARLKESALRESMEQLRATFNATTDGILVVSQDLKVIQANRQFYAMWRIPPELQATDDDAVLRDFVKDQLADPPGFAAMVQSLYHSRTQAMYELPMADGRVFECYTAPMIMDDREIGRVWDFRDISERKRAEEYKETLQAQLHQSKKLEAVGILAGGVAHDFNNMLGAITGYAELALEGMAQEDPFRKNLERILDAARRSADLTRQLLAFARKQTIEPVVLDLNQAIESILSMVRRIIGENIELIWLPCPDPCPVKMDPSQLDQILINLCVNARDAIDDVGRLTIETTIESLDEKDCARYAECLPGDYALLAVSDSGWGMDAETLAHIFEPFYTTKGLGQGTGMGLATVYGIVKQNGGAISVASGPGQGARFRIHIPKAGTAIPVPRPDIMDGIPHGRGETIVIIEDDPTLLELCTMMLDQLGYTVLAAGSPTDALDLIRTHEGPIDLIITDVIMPGMNGRELADRIESLRPGIRRLFMSGYTADAITHQGVLEVGVHFIQKPFGLKPLAVKIRETLG
ncbi:hypothetical protein JCM14469_18170 [Desulfatiferula olefinivorans]